MLESLRFFKKISKIKYRLYLKLNSTETEYIGNEYKKKSRLKNPDGKSFQVETEQVTAAQIKIKLRKSKSNQIDTWR